MVNTKRATSFPTLLQNQMKSYVVRFITYGSNLFYNWTNQVVSSSVNSDFWYAGVTPYTGVASFATKHQNKFAVGR